MYIKIKLKYHIVSVYYNFSIVAKKNKVHSEFDIMNTVESETIVCR